MSAVLRLMAFVKDRPNQWLPATAFEQFGRQSWRTRISDARKKFEAARDGTIENRVRRVYSGPASTFAVSEYRYVPGPVSQPDPPVAGHDTTFSLR